MNLLYLILVLKISLFEYILCDSGHGLNEDEVVEFYSIRGKLLVKKELAGSHNDWLKRAHIFADGGKYIGIPNREGEFTLTGIPSGSYMVEIAHPTFVFPKYRVEINSKGRIRARILNNVDTTKVDKVEYPMIFEAKGKIPYFEKREEWKITDVLKNPMVLMLILPMALMFLMPKMMNVADEETKKEMESQMSMMRSPKQQLPDISETLTSWLAGASATSQTRTKSRQKRNN